MRRFFFGLAAASHKAIAKGDAPAARESALAYHPQAMQVIEVLIGR